jgi:hypothetical protein
VFIDHLLPSLESSYILVESLTPGRVCISTGQGIGKHGEQIGTIRACLEYIWASRLSSQ